MDDVAEIFAVYNAFGVIGKLLVAVFLASPRLKRSSLLCLPFPLTALLSLLLPIDWDWDVLATGDFVGSIRITQSQLRLNLYGATAGIAYGFIASTIQVLVKEMFGLRELAKIQPLIYGAVIVGCMVGISAAGVLRDVMGNYRGFLALSSVVVSLFFVLFVFIFLTDPIRPLVSAKKPIGKEMH